VRPNIDKEHVLQMGTPITLNVRRGQWAGGWRWQWPANPPGFDPESGCYRGVAPDPRSEAAGGGGASLDLKNTKHELK
jgi:hypothetical protein